MRYSRIHVFALVWLFGCVVAFAGCQSPESGPVPGSQDKTQRNEGKQIESAPTKADPRPKQQFTDSGARIFYDRHPVDVDPDIIWHDEETEPAIVEITFVPYWRGAPAPEFLSSITHVQHLDVQANTYFDSTEMRHLGGGRYRTEERAGRENVSGWRVSLSVFGQDLFVRSTELRANVSGVVDFGRVEIPVDEFLLGHTLLRGRIGHSTGTRVSSLAYKHLSFSLAIDRDEHPNLLTTLWASPTPDGTFILGVPHQGAYLSDHVVIDAPPLTKEEIRDARVSSEIGGEWTVVREGNGILELGNQTLAGGILDCVLNVVLPKGLAFPDQDADETRKVSLKSLTEDLGAPSLDLGTIGSRSYWSSVRYIGDGQLGVRLALPAGWYRPKWQFLHDGGSAHGLYEVRSGEVTNSTLKLDLSFSDRIKAERPVLAKQEPLSESSLEYRTEVQVDTNGFEIAEGTVIRVYSETHHALRTELKFESGRFPSMILDNNSFPISEPTQVTLALHAHPKWGFMDRRVSKEVQASLGPTTKHIALALNQGQVVAQPTDGHYFVRALCGEKPTEFFSFDAGRFGHIRRDGEWMNAERFYWVLDSLNEMIEEEGTNREAIELSFPEPGQLTIQVKKQGPIDLSRDIRKRFSRFVVSTMLCETEFSSQEQVFAPAHRGVRRGDFVAIYAEVNGTLIPLFGGPHHQLRVPSVLTPISCNASYKDWRLLKVPDGIEVELWGALQPGEYCWAFSRDGDEVFRESSFTVPDQQAFFTLPEPKLPAHVLGGRMTLQIDLETIEAWIDDEVKVGILEKAVGRRPLSRFLNGASRSRKTADMRLNGNVLELSMLPTDREVWVYFFSAKSKLASQPIRVALDKRFEMNAGRVPELAPSLQPEGFAYITPSMPANWKRLKNYDQSIDYRLFIDDVEIHFDHDLFLGKTYRLELYAKGAPKAASPVAVFFNPVHPEKPYFARKLGWEADAVKKVQPLLKDLPINKSRE